MKQLTIISNNNKCHFQFDKRKIIIGDNDKVCDLFNDIRYYFAKLSSSEYSKENNTDLNILIDDTSIDLKTTILLDLTNGFDLINEYKLNQKSLLYMVTDTFLRKAEYSEDIQTINALLDDFSTSIEEEFIDNDIPICISGLELSPKFILSNIEAFFTKEGCVTNQLDYSLNELNRIKESMFLYLVKTQKQITFIILDELNFLNYKNYLLFPNIVLITRNKKNITLEQTYDFKHHIDYADENQVYDLYMNSGSGLDFDGFKVELLNKISK